MVNVQPQNLAFVFPGQASQKAGMAMELLANETLAQKVFKDAGEILGFDLAEICARGSDEELTRTEVAQPALFTTSAAWLAVLQARELSPLMVAGHSVGEFTAWLAAGALDFRTALKLVAKRGELMDEAARRNPGSMLAVIGLKDEVVVDICWRATEYGMVVPANYNCPGQVVVSGERSALERVSAGVKAAGGKALPIRVSGAFHSPLVEEAAHTFFSLVREVQINDPKIPVIANATAEAVTTAVRAREVMTMQMTRPVLWAASIQRMIASGINTFIEVGPGAVLSKLLARISPVCRAIAVENSSELQALLK